MFALLPGVFQEDCFGTVDAVDFPATILEDVVALTGPRPRLSESSAETEHINLNNINGFLSFAMATSGPPWGNIHREESCWLFIFLGCGQSILENNLGLPQGDLN